MDYFCICISIYPSLSLSQSREHRRYMFYFGHVCFKRPLLSRTLRLPFWLLAHKLASLSLGVSRLREPLLSCCCARSSDRGLLKQMASSGWKLPGHFRAMPL